MQVRFLGPLGMVTGSCTWMRDVRRGWNFLVDCGMQQGERSSAKWNKQAWPFRPAELNFVVLTHAHIDHCGLLPRLYQDGFNGVVYCPQETRDLAIISLKDAARHSNGLYTEKDVERIQWHEPKGVPLLGGTFHPVGTDLFLKFYRTGHIVGAVSVAVYWGSKGPDQRSIVFSGDLGSNAEGEESLPFLRFRMHPVPCNFAVLESTYGARVREANECDPVVRREALRTQLDRVIETSGTLVLPAFSLGRTQDVLFDLHWIAAKNPKRYGVVTYYLDAPGARSMHQCMFDAFIRTETNGKNGKVRPLWLGKQIYRWLDLDEANPAHVQRVLDIIAMTLDVPRETDRSLIDLGNAVTQAWRPLLTPVGKRRELMDQGLPRPCVIVTGAGSCDGGPVRSWLPHLLGDTRTVVGMLGYAPPSSIAGQLLSLRATPVSERARHTGFLEWSEDERVAIRDVRASIVQLGGYSAHADQRGLVDWLVWSFREKWETSGQVVFIQHGADDQRLALRKALEHRAGEVGLPVRTVLPDSSEEWFDLDAGASVVDDSASEVKISMEIERLKSELVRLRMVVQPGSRAVSS